jgi:hypothetical protein
MRFKYKSLRAFKGDCFSIHTDSSDFQNRKFVDETKECHTKHTR